MRSPLAAVLLAVAFTVSDARAQLLAYPTVTWLNDKANGARVLPDDGGFSFTLESGALMPRADATDTDGMLEVFERLLINGRARAPERVDSLMIADPIVLAPDDDLLRVADIMVTHQIRRLPVVEGKRVIGTLSRADLCRALLDDGC